MTSEEVVKAFISRIKAVNPIINSVVDNRFELALEEARNIDEAIKSGEKDEETLEQETPFLGVPFTIKDCFSVKGTGMQKKLWILLTIRMCYIVGLRYTSGLVKRRNIIGEFDSDVVALMKKAGGVMLAITNVPGIFKKCYVKKRVR